MVCGILQPHESFPTASAIKAFVDELKGFSTSKGTVHFPLDRPLPVTLTKKMVKLRESELPAKRARNEAEEIRLHYRRKLTPPRQCSVWF